MWAPWIEANTTVSERSGAGVYATGSALGCAHRQANGSTAADLTIRGAQKLLAAERRADERRERHDAALERVAADVITLPAGRYHVIVVDPPWRYELRPQDASHRVRRPYPDMGVGEICDEARVPVRTKAQTDCVLWLWATNAHLREAFGCLDAWGFVQKTMLTWVKDRMGVGDWLRGQTEHCLMAVRGRPVVRLDEPDDGATGARASAFAEAGRILRTCRGAVSGPPAGDVRP